MSVRNNQQQININQQLIQIKQQNVQANNLNVPQTIFNQGNQQNQVIFINQ